MFIQSFNNNKKTIRLHVLRSTAEYGFFVFITIIFSISTATLEAATVAFSWDSSSVNEGVPVWDLKVELSSVSLIDASVDYAVTGGSASGNGVDYTLSPGQLTIPAGEISANVSVTMINDTLDELEETIRVTLSNPQNAALGSITSHTLTIVDNEATIQRNAHIRHILTDQEWTVIAARHSYIVTLFSPHAGGIDISAENNRVSWIKSLNPNNKVLVYASGVNLSNWKKWGNNREFEQDYRHLLLEDVNGNPIHSRTYSNAIVPNIGNPQWQDMVAEGFKDFMDNYGYDGIFIDLFLPRIGPVLGGQPDVFDLWPINPDTNELYTNSDWKQDQTMLLQKIRNKIGNDKIIIINSVYTGQRYFDHTYSDYFVAPANPDGFGVESFALKDWKENWDEIYKSESKWKYDIDMLVDADKNFPSMTPSIYPKLPLQAEGENNSEYQQKVESVGQFLVGSFLLGAGENILLGMMTGGPEKGPPNLELSIFYRDLGNPLGSYYKDTDGVYKRDFDRAEVFVNPKNIQKTVNLTGTWETFDGNTVPSPLVLASHTAAILKPKSVLQVPTGLRIVNIP